MVLAPEIVALSCQALMALGLDRHDRVTGLQQPVDQPSVGTFNGDRQIGRVPKRLSQATSRSTAPPGSGHTGLPPGRFRPTRHNPAFRNSLVATRRDQTWPHSCRSRSMRTFLIRSPTNCRTRKKRPLEPVDCISMAALGLPASQAWGYATARDGRPVPSATRPIGDVPGRTRQWHQEGH